MFNFVIIRSADGSEIIDQTQQTDYDSLSALEMLDYMTVDQALHYMERQRKKEARKQASRKGILRKIREVMGL